MSPDQLPPKESDAGISAVPQPAESTAAAQADPQITSWERFFKKHYRGEINELALAWPTRRSLEIDWFKVDSHDPILADAILQRPVETLAAAAEAVKLLDVAIGATGAPHIHVRVVKLPEVVRKNASALRVEHLGRFVSVRGVVKAVQPVSPNLRMGVFKCGRCGNLVREVQDEHLVQREPLECYEEQGGCGRDSSFKLIAGASKGPTSLFVNVQRVVIQEDIREVKRGANAEEIVVWFEDDLVQRVQVGQRVRVSGMLRSHGTKREGVKSTIFATFLEANSIEHEEREDQSLDMTPDEIQQLRGLAASPDRDALLERTLAPDIHGYWSRKLALLLAHIGGNRYRKDGKRHHIHVALIGDPGAAKTLLVEWFARLAPRVVTVDAPNATPAGLTMGIEKGDNDKRELRAGSIILASGGWLFIDEAQQAPKGLLTTLHTPMESQRVAKSVTGAPDIEVRIDTTVILVANPTDGRFNAFDPLAKQFGLLPATLSRFDLIFVFIDKASMQRDRPVLEAMFEPASDASAEEEKAREPPFDIAFMRKFVHRASLYKVETPSEVRAALLEAGLELRNPSVKLRDTGARRSAPAEGDEAPIHVTYRTPAALERLAQAHAKFRRVFDVDAPEDQPAVLSTEDVDAARKIIEDYLEEVTAKSGDLDALTLGESSADRQLRRAIRDAYGELAVNGTARKMDVFELLRGEDPKAIERVHRRMLKDGDLHAAGQDRYKLGVRS